MAPLFTHDVEPGVRIVGAPLEHARAGACVRIALEGLTTRGQRDVCIVVRAAELDANVTDALRLLSTIAAHAKTQPLDVGDTLTLRNRPVFGAFKGVALAASAQVPGALVAVPLHDGELDVAERSGAPRVLAHLASVTRAWPFPEEVMRDRPPCIGPDAVARSAFARGMARAGACSATVVGGRALVTLGKRASVALLSQLRGGRSFVCGAPLDDTSADAVWVARSADRPPAVFSPASSLDSSARLAATLCAFTVGGDSHRGARVVEDGVAVVLGAADARRLCGALETGTPFFLDDPAPGALKLTLRPADGPVSSARQRVERVFLTSLELITDEGSLDAVEHDALARFHDALVVAVDRAVDGAVGGDGPVPAAGVELRVRHRIEPGRAQPRVSVLKTEQTSQHLVETIGDALCALAAPEVRAPVAFEVVLTVL